MQSSAGIRHIRVDSQFRQSAVFRVIISLAEREGSVYVRVPVLEQFEMQLGADMVHLGRQELDVWLGEPDDFVLAVLRDIYADETEVELWLNTPHNELGGRVAVDLLSAGRVSEVESILIDHWNGR